jgi:hypothetical protein
MRIYISGLTIILADGGIRAQELVPWNNHHYTLAVIRDILDTSCFYGFGACLDISASNLPRTYCQGNYFYVNMPMNYAYALRKRLNMTLYLYLPGRHMPAWSGFNIMHDWSMSYSSQFGFDTHTHRQTFHILSVLRLIIYGSGIHMYESLQSGIGNVWRSIGILVRALRNCCMIPQNMERIRPKINKRINACMVNTRARPRARYVVIDCT